MTSKLIKLRLLASFGQGGKSEQKRKSKLGAIPTVLIYLLVLVAFASIFTSVAVLMAPVLIAIGADWFYFLMFVGLDALLVFIFGVFQTKAEIFECRDNELLLSMPIKPISIVLSRVLSVIIWNYIESLIVFAPAVTVYAAFGGSLRGIIGGILLFFIIPLLPTALSCLVGFAVSLLSSRMKNKTFFSVIFFLAFFAAYMYGYGALMDGMDSMLTHMGSAAQSVGRFALIRAIGEAALLKPLPLLLLALISIASAVLTVLVIAVKFDKIAVMNRGERKVEYKEKYMSSRSVLSALVGKELSRFFSSAAYMINSALGVVFGMLAAAYILFKAETFLPIADVFAYELDTDAGGLATVALVSALILTSSFSYISSCSLSLEGKSLWIPRSLPIGGREVLLSKVIAHLVITVPFTLVSSVLLLIASGAWAHVWYYVLLPLSANLIGALVGVLWNVLFPKFEFTNEAMVVKNSLSVFLTMISLLLLGIGLAALGIWLLVVAGFFAAVLVQLAVSLLIAGVLLFVLLKYAAKRFESF
ncbi:MAG: hypothetical protein IKB38_05595 [Clostridia bacterium]|nr:hypothetical protein [Clostridia bacterium]